MKKLLFVISQLYKGGAETSLVNLLNNLDYKKYEVDLVILNQEPVENAVSLIDRINDKVKICDAYSEYQNITFKDRVRAKVLYTAEQKFAFWFPALDFVRNKIYDWAFFVGEWYSPAFVAKHTKAKVKAAWIHNDLSEAEYFDEKTYFYFYEDFDCYIFVSKNSMQQSVQKYPFIKDKATIIYNINDDKYIFGRSNEKITEYMFDKKLPTLLTCANFRLQKNHIRQVEAMSILNERNIKFNWLNIGATTDKGLVNKINDLAKSKGLENNFIILNAMENPYKFMKHASAITVLSDYESWSMVITEAKILGKPVIATKTSGALEQIEHMKTGLLTDFDALDIADKIEEFLKNIKLQNYIEENIKNYSNTDKIIKSFDNLIETSHINNNIKDKEKVLYIIDDINYLGGAHIATKLQIKHFIKEKKDITIFSTNIPNPIIRNELLGVKFISWRDLEEDIIFNYKFIQCITDKSIPTELKKYKFKLTFESRVKGNKKVFEEFVLPHLSRLFSNYDIICVMSEGSNFRKLVSKTDCMRKIQWIHIDYCDWKDKSEWTRKITQDDGELYKNFDQIVLLTENIKEDFARVYPHLMDKLVVNKNIIPVDEIILRSQKGIFKKDVLKFVTVGRIDYQKAFDRLISVLKRLKNNGYEFYWTIIGYGNEYNKIESMIEKSKLEDCVFLKGAMSNPFPIVKESDVFALLSDFEGLPNTIYESLILGVPVIATNVGGVKYQVIDKETGWLVKNEEHSIYQALEYLLNNRSEINEIKEKLKTYKYNNDEIMRINENIFSI